MRRRPPFREGRVHVLSRRCDTCVFRAGNLMSLRAGRLKELVEENLAADTAFACHETLNADEALCRGFVDRYADRVSALRLAQVVPGVTCEVDPPPSWSA